jgi:BlaI family transcriptional regulator, penicillinase repressor
VKGSDDPALPGGGLEYAILRVIWDSQTALSAREIYERAGAPQGLALTTITKVLDRLQLKGLVERSRGRRTFSYWACVDRSTVDGARVRRILADMLDPRPRPALAALVQAVESIDPSLLEVLANAVEARRRSRNGS